MPAIDFQITGDPNNQARFPVVKLQIQLQSFLIHVNGTAGNGQVKGGHFLIDGIQKIISGMGQNLIPNIRLIQLDLDSLILRRKIKTFFGRHGCRGCQLLGIIQSKGRFENAVVQISHRTCQK